MAIRTKWLIDTTLSEIEFKIKHMMVSTVVGHFESFQATVETVGDDFKDADIEVKVEVDSLRTKEKDRDDHLKADDFFNVKKFPEIVFKSKSFDGECLVGALTIRDTTKEVSLDVKSNGFVSGPSGQDRAGFVVSGVISRKDFGLTWNAVTEAGHFVVSDNIRLTIGAQFVKQV